MENAADHDAFTEKREYARIDVAIRARIQPLDEERAARLGQRILDRASVWAPGNEATLREVAATGGRGTESILAQAVLELASEIARLRTRVLETAAPVKEAVVSQLSGGGGRIICDMPFDMDDLFELRFEDDDEGIPPIHAVARVIHRTPGDRTTGFRYEALHRQDQDLLIRLIYKIQRRQLRRSHEQDD